MVDLGTGDGRYVLACAAADPDLLAIGIDASRDGMLDAAVRVQRAGRRGALTNARFVLAAAQALPGELDGLAHEVTVHFPWGSLLRGLVTAEASIVTGLARLLRPGARVTALLSVTSRDARANVPPLEEGLPAQLSPHYAAHGLTVTDWRPAAVGEIAETRSTWAKRLGAGRSRPVWRLQLQRTGE